MATDFSAMHMDMLLIKAFSRLKLFKFRKTLTKLGILLLSN